MKRHVLNGGGGRFLTVLSHSAGAQSHALLEMLLRGEIKRPPRFVVINADPGMEDSRTYRFIREARRKCLNAGIDYITAPGPNLYHDIVNSRPTLITRMDNPPFWVRNPDGTAGKLKQQCTQFYKIAPMRRAVRRYLDQIGRPKFRPGLVETWIGFAFDEWHRCGESDVAYITLRYPLIEKRLDRIQIEGLYLKWGIPKPPRSVCAACFSNGLEYFREMYLDRPDDWEKAVDVDNAIEFWHVQGITKLPVFVSRSLIRLRDMPALNFGTDEEDLSEQHCNSGACFI